MNGVSARGPIAPIGPRPNSGKAEPSADSTNSTAATISPPLRPTAFASQPATPAPMMQPNKALDMVQPERLPRAVSERCNGSMKLASIELTAPEITAVSYPNRRPPSVATNVKPVINQLLFFSTHPPQIARPVEERW